MTKELLAIFHRIERVADIISNDKAGGHQWNTARANEIKELVNMAARLVQDPLNNGK